MPSPEMLEVEAMWKSYAREEANYQRTPVRLSAFATRDSTWRASSTFKSIQRRGFAGGLIGLVILLLITFVMVYMWQKNRPDSGEWEALSLYQERWQWISLLGALATIVGALLFTGIFAVVVGESRKRWLNQLLIEMSGSKASTIAETNSDDTAESSDTDESGALSLESLWDRNRQQIENYHKIVLNYASSSRTYTLIALGVGFAFILIVTILAVTAKSDAAIPAAVVAASSAALTGFVANASLRNSESSSQELRAFFGHPLDVERALAAERLVNAMPSDEQGKARLIIINYLAGKQEMPADESGH